MKISYLIVLKTELISSFSIKKDSKFFFLKEKQTELIYDFIIQDNHKSDYKYESIQVQSDLIDQKTANFLEQNPTTLEFSFTNLTDSSSLYNSISKDKLLRTSGWNNQTERVMQAYQSIYQSIYQYKFKNSIYNWNIFNFAVTSVLIFTVSQ